VQRPDVTNDGVIGVLLHIHFFIGLGGGSRVAGFGLDVELAADHFLIRPGPNREIDDGVMQRDDAFAAFDELLQVLPVGFRDGLLRIVEDDDVEALVRPLRSKLG
jgi:hypothetical protein